MARSVQHDNSLVESFLAGAGETHDLVRTWVEPVVRSGNWRFSDAESVTQEVLLKLVTILRKGSFREDASFRTFVTSVARHTCIDVYRRERFRGRFESPAPEDREPPGGASDPERRLRRRERFEHLMFIFQSLPEECRELWKMIYGDSLRPSEVARRLGISAVTARVRAHRCMQKARRIGARFLAVPASS